MCLIYRISKTWTSVLISGLDCRKKLRKNLVMRNVLRQMCDKSPREDAKVLQPYKKCFVNLELLYHYCNIALKGREDHVSK